MKPVKLRGIGQLKDLSKSSTRLKNTHLIWIWLWRVIILAAPFSLLFKEYRPWVGSTYLIILVILLLAISGDAQAKADENYKRIFGSIKIKNRKDLTSTLNNLSQEFRKLNECGHKYIISEDIVPFLDNQKKAYGDDLIKELKRLILRLKHSKDEYYKDFFPEFPDLEPAFNQAIETLENELKLLDQIRRQCLEKSARST